MLPNGYLQLDPVAQEDEGEYTCTATNQYGTDSSTGRLRVLGKMIFDDLRDGKD